MNAGGKAVTRNSSAVHAREDAVAPVQIAQVATTGSPSPHGPNPEQYVGEHRPCGTCGDLFTSPTALATHGLLTHRVGATDPERAVNRRPVLLRSSPPATARRGRPALTYVWCPYDDCRFGGTVGEVTAHREYTHRLEPARGANRQTWRR
jgi:hypothetical protein